MPIKVNYLKEFKLIVGANNCISDQSIIKKYLEDWRGQIRGSTPVILFPKTLDEVQQIVSFCFLSDIKIISQGGNTSLCGANVPQSSEHQIEIILNTSKLNKFLSIDPYNQSIIVESGCILQNIQEIANDNDLFFPLSLSAEGSCQIGGNASTNAGGVNVLKYGMTRDQIIGIEVVLPDGSIFSDLKSLKKDNTGYDLKQLFIGAEGTLGVITKVSLKLATKPKNTVTGMVAVNSVDDAIVLLQNIKTEFSDCVTAFEFMSDTCIQAIEKYLSHIKLPLGIDHSWQIIFEIINHGEQDIINFLENNMESSQITDGLIANSEKEKNEIWLVRHSISEAEKLSGRGYHYDISVPIKRIPEFLAMTKPAIERIVGKSIVYTFGHLGDGNLHFTKQQPETMSESEFLDKTHEINREVHNAAETLGGSFSAEHGIGSKLMDDLVHFSNPVKIQLMQTIKKSLDPKNIMNPNKLIKI